MNCNNEDDVTEETESPSHMRKLGWAVGEGEDKI